MTKKELIDILDEHFQDDDEIFGEHHIDLNMVDKLNLNISYKKYEVEFYAV